MGGDGEKKSVRKSLGKSFYISQMVGANGPGGKFNYFIQSYQQRTTLANEVGERERDHLNARDATPAPQ